MQRVAHAFTALVLERNVQRRNLVLSIPDQASAAPHALPKPNVV